MACFWHISRLIYSYIPKNFLKQAFQKTDYTHRYRCLVLKHLCVKTVVDQLTNLIQSPQKMKMYITFLLYKSILVHAYIKKSKYTYIKKTKYSYTRY